MRERSVRDMRLISLLRRVGLAVAASLLLSVATAGVSNAEETTGAVIANPGVFHAAITHAVFDINGAAVDMSPASSYVEGTVDSNGTISIPTSGIHIEQVSHTFFGVPFVFEVTGSDTWTGQIDPSTKEVALRIKATINITNLTDCVVGPIDVNRGLGSDYNLSDGSFSVTNETYSITPLADGACSGLATLINGDSGLGLSNWVTGRGKTTWNFKLDPILTSGGGTLGGLSATDPFDTSSAGGSVSSTSISSSTTNIYGTSTAAAPKIRIGASIASKNYKKKYISIYASSSEDATVKVSATLSGHKSIKGKKLGSDSNLLQADEEKTFKLKVSKKLRKKIASLKAKGKKIYASVRVTADNGGDEPTVKKITKFKL